MVVGAGGVCRSILLVELCMCLSINSFGNNAGQDNDNLSGFMGFEVENLTVLR